MFIQDWWLCDGENEQPIDHDHVHRLLLVIATSFRPHHTLHPYTMSAVSLPKGE
jgi:hypothetical protein